MTTFAPCPCASAISTVIAVPVRLPTNGTISRRPQRMAKKKGFLTPTIEKPMLYMTHRQAIIINNPVRYFCDTFCALFIVSIAFFRWFCETSFITKFFNRDLKKIKRKMYTRTRIKLVSRLPKPDNAPINPVPIPDADGCCCFIICCCLSFDIPRCSAT